MQPGESSNTSGGICDIDYLMDQHANFYMQWSFVEGEYIIPFQANAWSWYILNITWRCENHPSQANKILCKPVQWNWGPQ